MATIPPINMGALKVTFPANLPRNEKDLICMLLAGRLKDLWKGRLVCAQLAIDDLIKSTTGVSALSSLRAGLVKLKGSLDDFKRASGYDKILGGVNKALGQASNVFSLGGLCPSPVQAPKIPDILATLNQNLFGQAGNILNALAQASNPKFCLGNGAKGFGLDWSKVSGDLKLLKNAIDQFKRDPAGFGNTMKAFESNIKSQAKRMNSELKRLESNLTDPLGINEKRNTVNNVKRVTQISNDFEVKDKNGIVYKNAMRSMIPGEIEYVLSRNDPTFTDPIKYQTFPVYDYCGVLTGYERRVLTGSDGYLGFDTVNTDLNVNTPTVNPSATYAEYDFMFAEEDGQIKIYNTDGDTLTDLSLVRGTHYRIGFKISSPNVTVNIRNTDNSVWAKGITVTKEPEYGLGFEVTAADGSYNFSVVEIDWAVNIENPTTPNLLKWDSSTGQQGNINISGPTSIPEEDKTYDVSMAAKKAWLNVAHVDNTFDGGTIKAEARYKKRKYLVTTRIVKDSGEVIQITNNDSESIVSYGAGLKVVKDQENFLLDSPVDGGKIIVMSQQIPARYFPAGTPPRYFVIKKFVNDDAGMQVNQVTCYITDGTPANLVDSLYVEPLASLQFDSQVQLLNDIKLPYTDYHDFKMSLGSNGKLNSNEESKIDVGAYNNKTYLNIHLSSERKRANPYSLPVNSFVCSSHIEIDPTDQARDYLAVDPVESQSYLCFRGPGNFLVECEMTYIGEDTEVAMTTQVQESTTGSYLAASSLTLPVYTLQQNVYQSPFRPVKINNARPPYLYSISPELPPGLIFDVDTGTIRGTPTDQQDRIKYTVSIDEEDTNLYNKQFYMAISIQQSSVPQQTIAEPVASVNFVAGPSGTSNQGYPLIGDPDTNIFVQYQDGTWNSRATAKSGKDYAFLEFTPGAWTLINLNSFQPVSVETQPIAMGNAVIKTWTVEGRTFTTSEPYTVEQYNPPLYAFYQLAKTQQRALIDEYLTANNLVFMTNGATYHINAYEGDAFRAFLVSKGLG